MSTSQQPPQSPQIDIWLAAKLGYIKDVQYFLSKNMGWLNKTDRYNNTPIYYAAYAGHFDIVYFLIKHGAAYDDRTILGALNTDIQRLLKAGRLKQEDSVRRSSASNSTISLKKVKTFRQAVKDGIEKVFLSLFTKHVHREKVNKSEKEPIPKSSFFAREDYSDFSIVICDDENSRGEIFHVHLLVLCARWKKFRKEYASKITHSFLKELETTSQTMPLEAKVSFLRDQFCQKYLQIDQNICDLKGKKMKLVGIEPNLFYAVLRYLYTLDFEESIAVYLNTKLESTDLATLIPKVMESLKILGLLDVLQNELYYFCRYKNAGYWIDSINKSLDYLSWRVFDFIKRDQEELDQLIKDTYSWPEDVKQFYELFDRQIRIRSCKACSDIILYTQDEAGTRQEFYCHKAVLVFGNQYFRTLLLGNFSEADILNDDLNSKSIASLEIEPALPQALEILLQYIYFADPLDKTKLTMQDLINSLVMAQKYDESELVTMIEEALNTKCDAKEIFNLYQVATGLFATHLISNLEKRIEMLYSTNLANTFADALQVKKELEVIGVPHLTRKLEANVLQTIQSKFNPFSEILYPSDVASRVKQVMDKQLYPVLCDEEFIEEDSDSERFAMLKTPSTVTATLQYLRMECPFCKRKACNYSSMFSHFALFCPQFVKSRLKLAEYARNSLQSSLKENTSYISKERKQWEPWFLPFTLDISQRGEVTPVEIQNLNSFQIMEKEMGILGYMPTNCSNQLRKSFNLDIPYQKQIDRIQRYIISTHLPNLFESIDKELQNWKSQEGQK